MDMEDDESRLFPPPGGPYGQGMLRGRHITVRGAVQGVFFREWTVQMAQSLDLTGWVRNRTDGSVEIKAFGDGELLDRFTDQLREGCPSARVDQVDALSIEPEALRTFTRRSTL